MLWLRAGSCAISVSAPAVRNLPSYSVLPVRSVVSRPLLRSAFVPVRNMATVQRSRADIVKVIQGQTLRLPDLENLFEGWPRVVNPHQDHVKDVVQDVLQKYTVSPAALDKLTKGNLGLLLATWFPFATPEKLSKLAYFVCWMYILDDEIDAMTAEGLEDSDARLAHLWDETLRVISESCALNGQQVGQQWKRSDLDSVEAFRHFGELLTEDYSVEQRQRFWDEIYRTANSYKKEQAIRKMKQVPQYDAYCDYRFGSCCMGQVMSMIEYANGSHLPDEIMKSPEMVALWRETAVLLWVNNDIISVKKEIADEFLENLVVIASKPNFRLQDGLDHCLEKLKQAISDLDKAASALHAKYVNGKSDQTAQEVDRFITNCRSISVGTCLWSRDSPRFLLVDEPHDLNGCITFTVGGAPA